MGLRTMLSSNVPRIIILHKYLLVLFFDRESSDKLMKSCDQSILHFNAIVLCNCYVRDGEGIEGFLNQHRISYVLLTKLY